MPSPTTASPAPSWRETADGVAELLGLEQLPEDERSATDQVDAVVQDAFAAGMRRVEAQARLDDVPTRRVLQRCALRPEGVLRGRGGVENGIPVDLRLFARLAGDPEPGTREAFVAMLDATLPLKRVIVQGLVRDGQGRIALCELTYKKEWDLVGGVADPAESPVASLAREVREEWGLELPVGELLAVNWLPPYREWRDAVLLVFDLGEHPDLQEEAVLQPSELRAVHWVSLAEAAQHVAPYVHRLLTTVLAHRASGSRDTVFCEDGLERSLPLG